MAVELLSNALVSGVLLGGLYVMASLGLAITFGLLDIPNVAHPTFIILGAYCVHFANSFGIDPIIGGLLFSPLFYLGGVILYWVYNVSFESRGRANTLQSFTFFFGIALVVEVAMILAFGVDLIDVSAPYIGRSLKFAGVIMPYRMIIPFGMGIIVGLAMWLFLAYSRAGLAIRALSYDANALRIVGLDPGRAKRHAFGLATMTAALAGAALIIVGPVDPFGGEQYIGRTFAIVVLAGMGSVPGTLLAGLLIGVLESLVVTFIGATWAPGVAFAALLATLALRPSGLFGLAR